MKRQTIGLALLFVASVSHAQNITVNGMDNGQFKELSDTVKLLQNKVGSIKQPPAPPLPDQVLSAPIQQELIRIRPDGSIKYVSDKQTVAKAFLYTQKQLQDQLAEREHQLAQLRNEAQGRIAALESERDGLSEKLKTMEQLQARLTKCEHGESERLCTAPAVQVSDVKK